jgi:hypothetical protein
MGISAAILTLILCITGLLLNHTESFELDKKSITSSLILRLYNAELPEIVSYPVNGNWLSHVGTQEVILNNEKLARCDQLVGAVLHEGMHYVACSEEVLLFDQDFEQIESVGTAYGLPSPLAAIGICENSICLKSENTNIYVADFNSLTWTAIHSEKNIVWSQSSKPPETLKKELNTNHVGSIITLERFVLDLHSGRLFGQFGVFLMDACAIVLLILVASGFWMWWRRP